MVTVCTKKFAFQREKILLSNITRKNEAKETEQFMKALQQRKEQTDPRITSGISVQNSVFKNVTSQDRYHQNEQLNEKRSCNNNSTRTDSQRSRSRVLSGTSVPNSTFKSLCSIDDKDKLSSNEGHLFNSSSYKSSNSIRTLRSFSSSKKESSLMIVKPEDRRSSILSGTGTLEELKELKDLLHKSSYIPKKPKGRRPTLEKIRSAIEKEKLTLVDQNECTINESPEMSDASTSTVKMKKKKVKSKSNTSKARKASSELTSSNKKNNKKMRKQKATKQTSVKVDVQIQCSIINMSGSTSK